MQDLKKMQNIILMYNLNNTQLRNNVYTCVLQSILNTSNNNTHENECKILYTFITIRYININMSGTTEDNTYCCKFCEYINERRDAFKNKVLINRIHKCKIVAVLAETQYIEIYGEIKNKQIEACNKYMEQIKMILGLGIEEQK